MCDVFELTVRRARGWSCCFNMQPSLPLFGMIRYVTIYNFFLHGKLGWLKWSLSPYTCTQTNFWQQVPVPTPIPIHILHSTLTIHLQYKMHNIIWIGMSPSYMLLCHLRQLISSYLYSCYSNKMHVRMNINTVPGNIISFTKSGRKTFPSCPAEVKNLANCYKVKE